MADTQLIPDHAPAVEPAAMPMAAPESIADLVVAYLSQAAAAHAYHEVVKWDLPETWDSGDYWERALEMQPTSIADCVALLHAIADERTGADERAADALRAIRDYLATDRSVPIPQPNPERVAVELTRMLTDGRAEEAGLN